MPERRGSAWPEFLIAHDLLCGRIEERLRAASLPGLDWYVVLWVLSRASDQRMRMSDLADRAVIARSNLTRLIDRMETKGTVVRERVEGDRRGAYARLTSEGDRLRRKMWSIYGPAIEELFSQHLSAAENETLRDLMLRLVAAARETDESAA